MVRRRFERIATGFDRLSLTSKGIMVVAIPVSALLVAIAVFYLLAEQNRQAQSWVEHSVQVGALIDRIAVPLSQSAGSEGYRASVVELRQKLDELARLTADNPSQQQHVRDLRSQIAAALGHADGLSGDAGRQFDARLRAIRAEEDRLLAQRTTRERDAGSRLEAAIVAGGLLGLLGGFVAAIVFTTGIVRRVQLLESGARQLAAGVPIVNEIAGADEIASLGRTLQQTSELLATQREQLEAAHSEMELRVQRRTRELTAAMEELRQANEVRHALVQSSPLAIWALDRDGKITFWNPAAERIFGYLESEAVARPALVIPVDQQAEYDRCLELFRRGGAIFAGEGVRRRKDDSRIDVITWTAPLRDADGEVVGTLVIDSDITDRKLLEEQFRQSQKLEAVGQLAGGVAHDFNNLLTVILGYVEMLLGGIADDPSLVECAEEIQHAATRAGALTAQLLAFSRRQIAQPQIISLNDVVTRSMRMLRRVIGEDIEITTHLAPQLGAVKADPTHIDQVIMNLVVNSRDAMRQGGRITIDTSNVRLDEDYTGRHLGVRPGAYVMLAISDTGSGMTPEIRRRLFEPFFTTKEAGKGTGLGLSIVYGVVKQNNGEIMVYSEPGQGTTFKIYLPVNESANETAIAEGHILDLRGTETVLLCEDEVAIRKLVLSMLSRNGYQVLEADTPLRAIEICRGHDAPIHLLLTDIVMPRLSGFELAREVTAMRPQTKVLYMSGYTDSRLSASWVFDPSTPFLHKPFTVSLLARKVREALLTDPSSNGASR